MTTRHLALVSVVLLIAGCGAHTEHDQDNHYVRVREDDTGEEHAYALLGLCYRDG
jgi:hypothetical protein